MGVASEDMMKVDLYDRMKTYKHTKNTNAEKKA